MKSLNKQSGFSAPELLLVLLIAAIIGVVGYYVYDVKKSTDESNANSIAAQQTPAASKESTEAKNVTAAPAINSAADLDKAQTVLDQNDPETGNSADSDQLDSQTANL